MSSLSLSFSSLSALNIKEKYQEEQQQKQEAFAISKQINSQKVLTQIFKSKNLFLLQTGVSILLLLLLLFLLILIILFTQTASQKTKTKTKYCQAATAYSSDLISVVVLVLVLFNDKPKLSYYCHHTLSQLFEKIYIQTELKFNSVESTATNSNTKSYFECSNLMNDKQKLNSISDPLKTNRVYKNTKYLIFFNKNYIYIELEFIKFNQFYFDRISSFQQLILILGDIFLGSFFFFFNKKIKRLNSKFCLSLTRNKK